MLISKIFKLAHKLAKKTLAKKSKAGKNYAVTFGACLKSIYARTIVEFSHRSKALKSGGKSWNKYGKQRVYFNFESLFNFLNSEVEEFGACDVYLDVKTNVFFSNNGITVRNALRAAGYAVKKCY